MTNPYTGAVASALRKCELLLGVEDSSPLQRSALQEAAVLQLWRAYRAFLAELAHQLQLGSEPESPQALSERASAVGKSCGEALEMQELIRDPESWLARLQASWVQLWSFSAETDRQARPANIIPVQNLSASGPAELEDGEIHAWHSALSELVRRQRAHSEEW